MRIAQEEIFGPVVCVIPYDDAAEAVRIANDSEYGLSGRSGPPTSSAASTSPGGCAPAPTRSTGSAWSSPRPFGGYKQSGIGREFGPQGLVSYLEYKTVHLPADYTPAE